MAELKPNSLKALSERGLELYACVDNDEAGIKFTKSNGLIPCNRILAENSVKDFNELLQTIERNRAVEKNQQSIQAAEKSPTSKIEAPRTAHKKRWTEKVSPQKREQFCSNAQKSVSDFERVFCVLQKKAVGVQGVSPCEMCFWVAKPPKNTIEYSTYERHIGIGTAKTA